MTSRPNTVRAADHLVDQLVAQGIDTAFGVPGESYLPVLDALHGRDDQIRFVTCRQEGGATMAADAYARLSGRPGVCFVTRGPGATNASAGVHVAFQDSTPLVLFIGQVARNMVEREAFQEIDYRRMFGQMAKWVAEIDDASRLQEYISRAFRTALSGRPGPVVLSLPEDMLYDDLSPPKPAARAETPRFGPDLQALDDLKDKIAAAQSPLVIAGGGGWTSQGINALRSFAETQGLPVAVSLRSQGVMNNDHPNYVGHFGIGSTPYLAQALKTTDLLIAIGPRLGEMTTGGYTLLTPPVPDVDLVHVFPQAEELGRVFEPTLSFVADTETFCQSVAAWEPIAPERFAATLSTLRADYETFNNPTSVDGDPLAPFFARLASNLPDDAILCNGAGNYAAWLHRFYRYRAPGSQLAPTSGSMGYGLPAAIGAATFAPNREVFAIAGDGCLMMTCQELATAVHHKLNLTVIVINNSRYGTIRAHQEREFPNRISGTDLTNPDFCAFAKSFGAEAYRTPDIDAFKDALSDARGRPGVKLIEVPMDPKLLSPGKWLS
ncbi:thiamine pyrophosphate-dependent enzyme [Marivita hallyeonensis]|uniref:Acetolactate synthase-1/2/3 large subunit n=1 Tax=Marivita hallyeonensis TaxID=996342 RepID=A0A1M5X402_9RHOB|nr:thiamine pyrophosphate-dependent enzyme [Marivita hallyeonensis]SHH94342.1 acetolactate synthase-1/2/3 large subunit [Marivita hallyeonensis]